MTRHVDEWAVPLLTNYCTYKDWCSFICYIDEVFTVGFGKRKKERKKDIFNIHGVSQTDPELILSVFVLFVW